MIWLCSVVYYVVRGVYLCHEPSSPQEINIYVSYSVFYISALWYASCVCARIFAVSTAQLLFADSFVLFVMLKPNIFISSWYWMSTMGVDLSRDPSVIARDLWELIRAPVAIL